MYRRYFKRIIDICIGLLSFPFVVLEIMILGPVIYLTDKGPIFYIADRIGKNGKIFKMYKLRSMKVNAPDIRNADGSTFNGDDDPRVTRIGRIIRKTSLDELPQIINVILGDMSLIGPRPNLPSPYENLSLLEKKRLVVRPGITGYNQAYYRNSVDAKEKFVNDVYYVDNLSFKLDCKIFIATIYSVLKRKNINNSFPQSK